MGERAGDGDLTEPFVREGPVPFGAGSDGERPLIELVTAAFFGVEPLEMLAYPFDIVCIPLSFGRILYSTKRLRLVDGLEPGLSTTESVVSTAPAPVSYDSAVDELPTTLSNLVWATSEDRRRRRELRVMGGWSTGTNSDEVARSDTNTAARIEGVGSGKCWSVLID